MRAGAVTEEIFDEFEASHHAAAGNILASLDNFLAETVEGSRLDFNPHSPTPGKAVDMVNGLASAYSGCQQCHGIWLDDKELDALLTDRKQMDKELGNKSVFAVLQQFMKGFAGGG